jgi:hypothetical protein
MKVEKSAKDRMAGDVGHGQNDRIPRPLQTDWSHAEKIAV